MKTTVTFGEIMGRLCPPGYDRFGQAMPGKMEVTFAGAEANVAVAIANLGGKANFVSTLPNNPIAEACLAELKRYGVGTRDIIRLPEGRMGLYFVECGANHRPSRVIYDRDYSSFSLSSPDSYDWNSILHNAGWFHITGITPAISATTSTCCISALNMASDRNLTISCDLNYRNKLWRWKPGVQPRDLAEETMRLILPHVDVVIANEADAADVLGIRVGKSDMQSGSLDVEHYPEVAQRIAAEFPNVKKVAITLRESLSASNNNWGAMLYDTETQKAHFAPVDKSGNYRPYNINHIVDRVGTGDSFAGALIYALQAPEYTEPGKSIEFAAAASCLAHSVKGDFNLNRRDEIDALMKGNTSGRVVR